MNFLYRKKKQQNFHLFIFMWFKEHLQKALFSRQILVWKVHVGLTIQVKMHFQISLANCGQVNCLHRYNKSLQECM